MIGVFFALVIGLMFTGVSLIILWQAWNGLRQERSWPRTTAEVISVAQERRVRRNAERREVKYVLVAHYRYRHPMTGTMLEGSSTVPDRTEIAQGSPVEICHHPGDPSRSVIPRGVSILGAGCVTVFILPFLAIGLAGLVAFFFLVTGGW